MSPTPAPAHVFPTAPVNLPHVGRGVNVPGVILDVDDERQRATIQLKTGKTVVRSWSMIKPAIPTA